MKEELKELGKEFLLASYIDVDFDYEDLSDEYRDKYSMLLDECSGDVDGLLSELNGEFIYSPSLKLIEQATDFLTYRYSEAGNLVYKVMDDNEENENLWKVTLDFNEEYEIKLTADIFFDGDGQVDDLYDNVVIYKK